MTLRNSVWVCVRPDVMDYDGNWNGIQVNKGDHFHVLTDLEPGCTVVILHVEQNRSGRVELTRLVRDFDRTGDFEKVVW